MYFGTGTGYDGRIRFPEKTAVFKSIRKSDAGAGSFISKSVSLSSTPSASAGRESVIRLIHRIKLAFKGLGNPAMIVTSIVMISPRLEESRKSTDFLIFS